MRNPIQFYMMENTDPSIIPDPDDIGVIIGEDLGEVEEEEELDEEEEDEDEDEEEIEEEEEEEEDDDIEVEEPVEED